MPIRQWKKAVANTIADHKRTGDHIVSIIVKTVDSHDTRIRIEEQYRDKLKLQKKGLMHDLLTDKVGVQI